VSSDGYRNSTTVEADGDDIVVISCPMRMSATAPCTWSTAFQHGGGHDESPATFAVDVALQGIDQQEKHLLERHGVG
jgi:hypothetical protein